MGFAAVVAGAAEVGFATAISESFRMGGIAHSLKQEFITAARQKQSSPDLQLYGEAGGGRWHIVLGYYDGNIEGVSVRQNAAEKS